jgi:hypothetical protein
MSQFTRWLPSRRQLQQHLARLVDTLEALVQRLRESIARTVGEAVANAVHEVTYLLIRSSPDAPARSGQPARESWDDRYESEWDDGPAYTTDRHRDDDAPGSPPETPASRWRHAMSVGCQTAAWWLARQVGRYPVLTSTGLGLTAALVSYAAGPIVGVGLAGIGGALLHLLGLTEAVASSATALGR